MSLPTIASILGAVLTHETLLIMTAPDNSSEPSDGDTLPAEIRSLFQTELSRSATAIESALCGQIRMLYGIDDIHTLSAEGHFSSFGASAEPAGVPFSGHVGVDLGNGSTLVMRHKVVELIPNGAPVLHPGALAASALAEVTAAGARPVAFLHTLRLGDLAFPETRSLLASFIAGMAETANRCGTPGIGGSLGLDSAPEDIALVQATGFGVVPTSSFGSGLAPAAGSPVYYASALHGFLGDQPSPGGDSFLLSRLCAAVLELHAHGIIAGVEATGPKGFGVAAGCLAARIRLGLDVDAGTIPGLSRAASRPDSLLEPSSDGLLIVVRSGQDSEAVRLLQKWDLAHAPVGRITETRRLRIRVGAQGMADIPVSALVVPTPAIAQKPSASAVSEETAADLGLASIRDDSRPMEDLLRMLTWPGIASRNWIDGQFDQTAGNGTMVCPGADAAVVRVSGNPDLTASPSPESSESPSSSQDRFLAIASEGNGAYLALSPVSASRLAIVEAARNLACMGAIPLGASTWVFVPPGAFEGSERKVEECVQGLAETCRSFATPWTRQNFSLQRIPLKSPQAKVSVMVTMTGEVEKAEHVTTPWFKQDGDAILLLGEPSDPADAWAGLGGSAYLQVIHGKRVGSPPRCDVTAAKTLHTALVGLIQSGGIRSAHDCSRGGLAVALAECCISGRDGYRAPRCLGASIDLTPFLTEGARVDALLFGETQSRVVISCAALEVGKILERSKIMGIPATRIGTVGGDQLAIRLGEREHIAPVQNLHEHWWHAIATAMQ